MVTDGLTYALRVGYVRILESYIFPSMVETTFRVGRFLVAGEYNSRGGSSSGEKV